MPWAPAKNPCRWNGPTAHDAGSPWVVPNCSSRHSAPAATLTASVTAYEKSAFRPTARCRLPPMSNAVGDVGPSEALMVS